MIFDKLMYLAENRDKFIDLREKVINKFRIDKEVKLTTSETSYQSFNYVSNVVKLFIFDKNLDKDRVEYGKDLDGYVMPYQHVAVEDKNSCIIISDREEGQIGLDSPRSFICIVDPSYTMQIGIKWSGYVFAMGEIERLYFNEAHDEEESGFNSVNLISYGAYDGKKFNDYLSDFLIYNGEQVTRLLSSKFISSLVGVLDANKPRNFILEEKTIQKHSKKKKTKKLLRSHQRPLYTILTPDKIRKKTGMTSKTGLGGSKRPHERRSYIRYMSDERYSEKGKIKEKVIESGPMKGKKYYKKKVIPACWIGESEKTVGNKKYKVILDM